MHEFKRHVISSFNTRWREKNEPDFFRHKSIVQTSEQSFLAEYVVRVKDSVLKKIVSYEKIESQV